MTTSWKISEPHQVYLACSPFTRQRRIIGAMGDGRRNRCALLNTGSDEVGIDIVGAHCRVNRLRDPIDHDVSQYLIRAKSCFELRFSLQSTAGITDQPSRESCR